jgi:rhamnogalacturonan endolyase
MENLGRGVVAIPQAPGKIYVGWRLLGTDPDDLAFNLYRTTGRSVPVRLNPAPLLATTDFVDTTAPTSLAGAPPPLSYFVRPILAGVEQPASAPFTLASATLAVSALPYFSVPLAPPPNGTTPDNLGYTYSANDCSAADLDGDGEYELIVKWDPSNSKDNSLSGYTGHVLLDAYKLDGTRLWRIDLGRNIRAGAHYTQFMVYDLDGDGRAELACKTADATVDGRGTVLGNPATDFRNRDGYILTGPEYLTVFDGLTGAALATTNYLPARNADPTSANVSAWGDNYGNRVDRFLAAVAYLDGTRPSLVMCRGYYTRAVLVAWDWRDGRLTRRWTFDSDDGTPGNSTFRGQGAHSLTIGDVDADGRDEIIYGAAAIDDNGKALYNTRLGHGDALHLSDMDPDRPG